MPGEYITDLTSTEKARKYNYLLSALVKTWIDNNFLLTNLKRAAARWAPGGRQAIIPLETATSGSFRFSDGSGTGGPAEAGTATYDEALVDVTTFSTSVEYTWHAKLYGQTDKTSFIQVRAKAVADAAEVMGYRWSHALFAPKHNAMARIKTDLGGGTWQLYTEGETNSNGTFGSRFLFKNGYSSASANTTGVAVGNFDGFTTSIDHINDQVTFTAAPGSNVNLLTAGDYIFWGSKNKSSKGVGLTGLPEIVDDGTTYAVFEGRNRTTAGNEDWQAGVHTGFGAGDIELEIMQQQLELNRRTGAMTDVILYGLQTQMLHFQQMGTARRAMMPVSGMKGGPTFTGGFEALPVSYGDRTIAAMANRENPEHVMYGLNWDGISLAMLAEPQWIDEGEGQFKYVPGTYHWTATLAGVGQVASKWPALHWVTQDITPGA